MKPYPYERLIKYPGMRPLDQIIWEQYIIKHPHAFHTVYYDIHIGEPSTDKREETEMRRTGAWEVSQWCVDVIGVSDDLTAVIEVKPAARASAIGQALAYRALLVEANMLSGNVVPMILTDELLPITERACRLLGVHVLVP